MSCVVASPRRDDGYGGCSVAETVRRRLRLFAGGSRAPLPAASASASASAVCRRPKIWSASVPPPAEASAVGTKRPANRLHEEGNDSSDDEEDVGILPVALPPPSRRHGKKRRRIISPCPTPPRSSSPTSLLTCDLYEPGYFRRKCRAVKFAEPIVTEVRTRPRTRPEDVERLFYRKADKVRFRRELREEMRLKSIGQWESDDEEEQ